MSFNIRMIVRQVEDGAGGGKNLVLVQADADPQIGYAEFRFNVPDDSGMVVPEAGDQVTFSGHYDIRPQTDVAASDEVDGAGVEASGSADAGTS